MKIVFYSFLFYFLVTTINGSESQFSDRLNAFSIRLYQAVINAHKTRLNSIILSPILTQKGLASLSLGTDSVTEDEILNGILLPYTRTQLAYAFHNLLSSLKTDKNLSMASMVFINNLYNIQHQFVEDEAYYYYTKVKSLDFKDTDKAGKIIDYGISQGTNGAIDHLMRESGLTSDTQCLFVDGISYNGQWAQPFNPWYTNKDVFYRPKLNRLQSSSVSSSSLKWDDIHFDTKIGSAELMNTWGYYKYGYISNLQAKALLMPYTDPSYNLLVLLPELTMGIFELETQIQHYSIESILSEMASQPVNVTFPRFTLNADSDLSVELRKMGLDYVFSTNATYYGVATPTGSEPPLGITGLIQKAQIIWSNSESYSQVGYPSSDPMPLLPFGAQTFKCNHPFLFYLLKEDTIIMIGRILSA